MSFRERLVVVVALATLLIGLDASLSPRNESGFARPAPAPLDVTDGEPTVETGDVDDLEPCDLGDTLSGAATASSHPPGSGHPHATVDRGRAGRRRGPAAAIRGPPARA